MDETSEISLKYQKLALEYSKLKSQIPVLKQAVSDEHSTVSELQDTLKKKDQLVRKLEQEVECLNFRNVQLAKRVSVLQNELELVDSGSKNSKGKHSNQSAPLPDSYNVLNSELQSRIEENERLHQQIYTADIEYEKKISDLNSTIESINMSMSNQEKELSDKIKEQEAAINTLQKEKIKMQVAIKNVEQEIKAKKDFDETKIKVSNSLHENLSMELNEAKRVIIDKVIFNDKSKSSLNTLNVPSIQRKKHENLLNLMLKMQTLVSDISRQLSDLHGFMIQRLCITSSESKVQSIRNKIEELLRENIQCLKALPPSLESVTSAIKNENLTWDKSSLVNLCCAFEKYVNSLARLQPFLTLRIQDKSSWATTSVKILDLIPQLCDVSKKVKECFGLLHSYINLLSLGETDGVIYLPQSKIIVQIVKNMKWLQKSFDEARKLFGAKIAADHQLPMLSQSEKSTDECILATLVSLSSTLQKIVDLIESDMDIFSIDAWYKPKNASGLKNLNPYVWQWKERGSKYLEQIGQNDSLSIPYEVALKNYHTLCDHADNQENLTQQLEQYQNKLMQLELDKENWMLECQLMRAKESKDPNYAPVNDELNAQNGDEIHLYVKNTVNQLIKQIQFADSKSIAFKNECENLHQKLKLSLQKKEVLEKDNVNSKQLIESMKEEHKTQLQSYEEQLNTMSEHLANLNETLTAQKDEIDALKQPTTKGSRKGKSK